MQNQKKLNFITNFKGILAMLVLLHHFALCFYPILVNGVGFDYTNNTSLLHKIISSPFNIFGYGGSLAVSLFFMISGFLITYSFYVSNDGNLEKICGKKIIKRYLDLFFPILFSSIFGYILGKVFINYNLLDNLLNSSYYQNLNYNIFNLIKDSLFSTFIKSNATYNPPLWTMSGEFFGSILIYIIILLFSKRFEKNIWFYYFLLIMFFNTNNFYFIMGLILAKKYIKNKENFECIKLYKKIIITILIIYLSGYCYLNSNSTLYQPLTKLFDILPNLGGDSVTIVRNVSTSLIFIFILSSKIIKKILSFKLFNVFGKYSVEIYLFHWPILYTIILKLTSILYYKCYYYYYSTFFGLTIFIILSFFISYLYKNKFNILVEKFKIKIYKLICK